MTGTLVGVARGCVYLLMVFCPLARGSVQPWAVTVIHLLTLTALTALVIGKSLGAEPVWVRTPLDLPFFALGALVLVSTAFSVHRSTSLWATTLLFNYAAVYYTVIHTLQTRAHHRRLAGLVVGVAVFLSVFAVAKRLGLNPFAWWAYPDITRNLHRLSGTYGNANHLAGYLEMAIPLALSAFVWGRGRIGRPLLAAVVMVMAAALVLTLSRAGWISCWVGLMVMLVLSRPSVRFSLKSAVRVALAVVATAALIVLSSSAAVERIVALETGQGLDARMSVWKGVVAMIRDHPWLGTGPGTFPVVFTQYQPPGLDRRYFMAHNDYLQFTAEAGLPLIIVLAWMAAALFRGAARKLKHPSRQVRSITAGALAGIAAILVHGTADFNLHIPANALTFTCLCALAAAPVPAGYRKEPVSDRTPPKGDLRMEST